MCNPLHRLIASLLVFAFISSPVLAQQRRTPPAKKPVAAEAPEAPPTFDTLLAADSFKVYAEVRAVGGLIRSAAVNDLLDPVMKLGGPPKEFKTLVKWLNAHAEVLAGSRMLVAGWPSRPNLPTVLAAIEFSSEEEAKKFYPELRGFLPTLMPTPTPTPTRPTTTVAPPSAPINENSGTEVELKMTGPGTSTAVQSVRKVPEKEAVSARPPYQLKLAGSLVLISETDFTFRNLRPRGAKLLEEDQNFMLARNRFASESIFLYVDLKSIEKEEKDRQRKWEEDEQKRIEAQAANPPKVEEAPVVTTAMPEASLEESVPPPAAEPSPQATLVIGSSDAQTSSEATLSGRAAPDAVVGPAMMFSLYSALFGGQSRWPEAISAALVFEGDAYVVRTLIVNGAENKGNAIPFVPQFVSGPALAPESPNIFPADTDLFVSVSLDYPLVYDGMLKAIASAEEMARKYRSQPVKDVAPPESPLAAYEKKLGLKIKDDILPLLGNEIALALPRPSPSPSTASTTSGLEKSPAENAAQTNARSAEPNPVIAISVKDREALARLIPKIIESFGMKGANFFAQTEKRDGTEITSYGNVFAYAFVGDFLIVSADAAATRQVVNAYLNHQTLSSNSHFRNFTRWQPRQVLGQVYAAPSLVEQYVAGSGNRSDKMIEFLSRVNPVIDPLTYSLTNDGQGPLHELHVPKNLLQFIIASASNEASQAPLQANEAVAKSSLRTIASAEVTYQVTRGDGRFGSIDELIAESLISKDILQRQGYRIELAVSEKGFEASAVPITYGESGRLSYFIDETMVLRGGDHGGGAATVADMPMD